MNMESIHKAIRNILYKASVDRTFREACLDHGKLVLEEELHTELEKDIDIKFKENDGKSSKVEISGKNLLFILPDFIGPTAKLEIAHLENITGGVSEAIFMNRNSIDKLISLVI